MRKTISIPQFGIKVDMEFPAALDGAEDEQLIEWYLEQTKNQPDYVPTLKELQDSYTLDVKQFATQSRAKIAGTTDPVKLAEYADKAAQADRLVEGSATAEEIAAAQGDHWAVSNGVNDPIEIGKVWQKQASGLRHVRNIVNSLEAQALAGVKAATSEQELETLVATLHQQANEALAKLAG